MTVVFRNSAGELLRTASDEILEVEPLFIRSKPIGKWRLIRGQWLRLVQQDEYDVLGMIQYGPRIT